VCDAVIDCKTEELTSSFEKEAKALKSICLRSLGEKEVSANGRNWYFTAALENEGYEIKPEIQQVKGRIYLTKMVDAFSVLTIRLCPIKSGKVTKSALFYFTDLDEYFYLQVRLHLVTSVPVVL
jgi:alkyl sulfatase BDS1-like metallo-beta-lactamase superfamily hydrolase